eukprot:TRINITY_DN10204_c0_g1_i1.p1 TRINITY_DN10204_c0_g1~~TRINITY_DN10204_c0_g1_i1.p1  ORF type:complete len:300 (-),score=54.73 TRINITY_DN10204_c0_g1_i1:503-1297(-)
MGAAACEPLLRVMNAFELLEESHSATVGPNGRGIAFEVRLVAASLCGCRLLRERLASLPELQLPSKVFPGEANGGVGGGGSSCSRAAASDRSFIARQRGTNLLRGWRRARELLESRWPALPSRGSTLCGTAKKMECLAKAVQAVSIEGFETDWSSDEDWQEDSHREDVKPVLFEESEEEDDEDVDTDESDHENPSPPNDAQSGMGAIGIAEGGSASADDVLHIGSVGEMVGCDGAKGFELPIGWVTARAANDSIAGPRANALVA